MAAIAQHDIADVAHAQTINVDGCARYAAGKACSSRCDLKCIPIFGNKNVLRLDADSFGEARMLHEHAIFTVHGKEIFRLREIEHEQQFFLTPVTRDVREALLTINDVDAE